MLDGRYAIQEHISHSHNTESTSPCIIPALYKRQKWSCNAVAFLCFFALSFPPMGWSWIQDGPRLEIYNCWDRLHDTTSVLLENPIYHIEEEIYIYIFKRSQICQEVKFWRIPKPHRTVVLLTVHRSLMRGSDIAWSVSLLTDWHKTRHWRRGSMIGYMIW